MDSIKSHIRDIPDFPRPGILFKDITPLLRDPAALATATDALVAPFRGSGVTAVLGMEARGFVFGALAAHALGAGFVPLRKPGKLPAATHAESFELEYGSTTLHMHTDALSASDRVLLVDDLIATGGTAAASLALAAAHRRSGARRGLRRRARLPRRACRVGHLPRAHAGRLTARTDRLESPPVCLLLVAHDCCPGYRLVVAANRDEFHARPTAPADYWEDLPTLFGGRDLEAGGSWLVCDTHGRFATLTNVRGNRARRHGVRSRGLIARDFLTTGADAAAFTAQLARDGDAYDGFNLLAYDGTALCWYSNQAPAPRLLERGVYTLSNAQLDTAWPKTERLRAGFGEIIGTRHEDIVERLLALLRDQHLPHDDELPRTGVGLAMERVLASIFIRGASYGTRCSTVVLIDQDDRLTFHERRYDVNGAASGDTRIEIELPGTAR